MAEAMLYRLRIDPEFKGLIPPMAQKEYIQLEMNLRSDGCRDPIVIWNSTIVDGHNRYQICHKYKIPFRIVEMNFGSREEAKVWICSNQLGRRNISVEYRRYLIGSQYELEKQIEQNRNKAGINQYTENNTSQTTPQQGHSNHSTAVRLANEHHISEATVQKYAGFTRAINKLGQKAPDMVPKLLTGQYKVSQDGVAQMAKMEPEELAKVASHFQEQQKPDFLPYSGARQGINAGKTQGNNETAPSVKDMPKYDPDAEVAGLMLTIPSWIKVIEHTERHYDKKAISPEARKKVIGSLEDLILAAQILLEEIQGE